MAQFTFQDKIVLECEPQFVCFCGGKCFLLPFLFIQEWRSSHTHDPVPCERKVGLNVRNKMEKYVWCIKNMDWFIFM